MTLAELRQLKEETGTLLAALDRALAAERAALRSRDAEALERAAADKTDMVGALEVLGGRICRLDRQTLAREFADLRPLAQALARANRVNGGAIELNRAFAERLLAVLHGGGRGATVYDASGRLRQRPGARQVGYA